jgi:cytochrome c biogenesis protein CcmG/thiol:disulfide interchange protein DsbE
VSRARFIPLIVFGLIVIAVAWRLAVPRDDRVASKLEGQKLPVFALPPALPGKPGLTSADLAKGSRAWSISSPAGACPAPPKPRCCST